MLNERLRRDAEPFWILPLNTWTGNKTEAYGIRQIPALYICSSRSRIDIGAVRQTFPVQVGRQRIAVYDNGRIEPAFPADVRRPVTYCVVGRHQLC